MWRWDRIALCTLGMLVVFIAMLISFIPALLAAAGGMAWAVAVTHV